MEHPFFPTTTTRAEALRWLTIAEKLLSARDLMGSKSFASRARDSDPTLSPADQILAVADTLLAGDRRIGNNQQDWYAILRLTPQQGRDAELIATQYRNLALLLNPQKNKFLSLKSLPTRRRRVVCTLQPSRKSLYDKELTFYLQPQQQPDPFSSPIPGMHQNFIFFGGSSSSGVTHPLQPQGAVHFSQVQVHANPQVDPVAGGSTREPQNFMSFTSGSNLVFGSASGSGSGSKPTHETVNKQAEESYSTFAGNVSAAPGATQEQVNNKNEQPQHNYSNDGDKTSYNVNVSENVEERIEEEEDADKIDGQEERVDEPANDDGSTFWTACPYCYYMYEYPGLYADCTLRCQNCKRAFQAVVIPSPPPIVDGQEGYFCCWGFLPLGFSMENWEKNRGAASSWTPFSPMYTCPQAWNGNNANKKGARKSSAPRVYVDDDEVFVEISESSESDDDDWRNGREKKKKKAKSVKGKGASGTMNRSTKKAQVEKGKNVNVQDGFVSPNGVETPKKTAGESSKKGSAVNARKQPGRVAKNKLDLNVEFSNEAEEPAPRANQGNGPSRGEDDNIEGIGFFEGLDEFLSSLPILNVVGDDKVVKAA
ncbi:UNVERIFIED_CONTAM: hypothetical protein Sangu_2691200 [Sesamum angustifolium]|uniref:Zinc beta-ribbon domain-containing protein n=1 Tax=Sesamum angustifolium TaxID=2727405 RepID=A0AAW2IZC3_9LAMI